LINGTPLRRARTQAS